MAVSRRNSAPPPPITSTIVQLCSPKKPQSNYFATINTSSVNRKKLSVHLSFLTIHGHHDIFFVSIASQILIISSKPYTNGCHRMGHLPQTPTQPKITPSIPRFHLCANALTSESPLILTIRNIAMGCVDN